MPYNLYDYSIVSQFVIKGSWLPVIVLLAFIRAKD